MRQTRKNIYDVPRFTISHILELKLPFAQVVLTARIRFQLPGHLAFAFSCPVCRTVTNQRRQMPNRNAQQTTQPKILKKHCVSNHRILHAFASPKEAPVCSVLTVLLPESVRGAVSTKVSDCSSLAGVHRWFKLELVHMEVESEDQENEVEDRKDGEECEVEVYQDNDDTMRMTHAMTCAQHLELEPMSM